MATVGFRTPQGAAPDDGEVLEFGVRRQWPTRLAGGLGAAGLAAALLVTAFASRVEAGHGSIAAPPATAGPAPASAQDPPQPIRGFFVF